MSRRWRSQTRVADGHHHGTCSRMVTCPASNTTGPHDATSSVSDSCQITTTNRDHCGPGYLAETARFLTSDHYRPPRPCPDRTVTPEVAGSSPVAPVLCTSCFRSVDRARVVRAGQRDGRAASWLGRGRVKRRALVGEVDRDESPGRNTGELVLARLRRADKERQLLLLAARGEVRVALEYQGRRAVIPGSSSAGMLNWL